MEYKNLHDFNTYHCYRNEVMISGKDEDGEDLTIIFDTIELISWLDTPYMKEQAIKYIKELGENEQTNVLDEEEEILSECCTAKIHTDTDICSACLEHI